MKFSRCFIFIFFIISISSFSKSRMFPLYGKEAEALGYTLPKTYGINFIYVDMDQDVDVEKLELKGLGSFRPNDIDFFYKNKNNLKELIKQKSIHDGKSPLIAEIIATSAIELIGGSNIDIDKNFSNGNIKINSKKAKTTNTTKTIRGDMWVFPFLNVYGLFGETKGKSISPISIAIKGITIDTLKKDINIPIPEQEIDVGNFVLNYEGLTYGAGMTLIGGYNNIFALTDINYTYTGLNIIEGDVTALIVSPKIGYHTSFLKKPITFWVGAMYQEISQTLKGNIKDVFQLTTLSIPGKFEVKEKVTYPWNYALGIRYEFTPNLEAMLEIGFKNRKNTTVSMGYRF